MKAAIYERTGAAHVVLRVTEVGRPEPGAGEVRVRLRVSGVNPTDWKTRAGATPRPIGAGAVGHFAIELARHAGARVVAPHRHP